MTNRGVFGIELPEDTRIGFTARAILSNGALEFLGDRQAWFNANPESPTFKTFKREIKKFVQPFLKREAKLLSPSSDEQYWRTFPSQLPSSQIYIHYSPRASFGYLYLSISLLSTEVITPHDKFLSKDRKVVAR